MAIFQKLNKTKESVTAELRIKNRMSNTEQVVNSIKDVYFEQITPTEIEVGLVTPQGDEFTIKFSK